MVRLGIVLNRTALVQLAVAPFMLVTIPFSLYYRSDDIPALFLAFAISALTSLGGVLAHAQGRRGQPS